MTKFFLNVEKSKVSAGEDAKQLELFLTAPDRASDLTHLEGNLAASYRAEHSNPSA